MRTRATRQPRGGLTLAGLGFAFVWLATVTEGRAQPAPAPAPGPAPAPTPAPPTASPPSTAPTAPAATPATPPPASTGTDYDCLPACREGFVCVMRQCVSACNPACPTGEVCTSAGSCVSACNPPCAAGQQCTSDGRCMAPAPEAAQPAAEPSEPRARINYMPGARPPAELSRHDDELAERKRTGKRFHDGFYLRLGAGVGYLISKWSPSNDSGSVGEGASSSGSSEAGAQGFTIPLELALGGTPTPGMVVGFGSWAVHVPAATYTYGRGDFSREEDASWSSIAMLGPFGDIYPAPRSGFHLQGAPCLALVFPGTSSSIVTEEGLTGVGFGAMLGLGYESWVADQWGLGVLLRAQVAYVTITDQDQQEYEYFGLTPSLLMTTTFH